LAAASAIRARERFPGARVLPDSLTSDMITRPLLETTLDFIRTIV